MSVVSGGHILPARLGFHAGKTGVRLLEGRGGQSLHFRSGGIDVGANARHEAAGQCATLIAAYELAHGRQHALVTAFIGCHGRERHEGRILQPPIAVAEVRQNQIRMGRDPIGAALADDLQRGVLHPPGFLGIFHRLNRKIEDFPIDHLRPFNDGAKHRAPHAGIRMPQQFHHQFLAHRAPGRAPADVAAVNAQHFVGGHKPNIVILMQYIFANQIIADLFRLVQRDQDRLAGISRKRLGGEILFFAGRIRCRF